ncbi:MAG: gliding motility-associated C-terminal domain-containing protein [Flavobacteriales bacterium]|nr:gliding motility-associated C-terminal domain-containing protein [Flavobacteriales bacterium]
MATDEVEFTFTPAPEVDAGEDIFACVDDLNVPLSGEVTGPTTSGVWSTSGNGTFVPSQFNPNASYIATSQDSLNGEVTITLTSTNNGQCTPVTDELTIFINPAGTADAGPDQTVCASNNNVSLQATIGGAANSGFWETSGTGIFTPSAEVTNPTYLPGEADIADGNVTLTFFVNSCNQASDAMEVTITPVPVVDAGEELTVCATEGEIDLNGSVSGTNTTGIWTTSGTGNFTPDAEDLNATYVFSAEDIAAQGVVLTLSATNIGNCVPVSDNVTLNIFPEGSANAGADITACANNAEVTLNGSLTGADIGLWTTSGSGSFDPDASTLNATYTPSQDDLDAGSVNLILTAVNSCNPASDFLTLNFTPAPVVDAGADQEVCGEVVPFQISGNVSIADGGTWTTSGSGTFQNANNLNTFYVASEDDIDAGLVTLTLTSTGNGNCLEVSSSLDIQISTGIVVDAGPDREVCSENDQTQLFGSVSNGSTTGIWSTSGNGSFQPNAESLNAVYTFTESDIAAGAITITLTSTNNGPCAEVSESFELSFGNTAFVFAGDDVDYCETQELIPLNGQVSGETFTGIWTTPGDGQFLPTATTLNAFYEPGPEDLSAGGINLTLTSTGSELCSEGSDELTIGFQPLPVADAGPDALVCGNLGPVQLAGAAEWASGGTWTTAGSGEFLPNPNVFNATYFPSQADSTAGSVELTLTTTGNGLCSADSDVMTISFSDAVVPNAGSNIEVCETAGSIPLQGSLQGSGTVEWSSSGNGAFDPGNTTLNTNYIPSSEDIEQGNITLYLAAETTGNCPGLTDSLTVVFDRLPTVEMNTSPAACNTSESVSLSANVSFQDAVLWSTSGTGTFSPNANAANVEYLPSEAELNAGSVALTFTAISNGACGAIDTEVILTFIAPATVNAGPDINACSNDGSIELGGVVSGSTNTGVWSTSGFGNFSPDNTALDGAYNFGGNDILLGFANLVLTSSNNGPCAAMSDTLLLTINPAPTVDAGNDIFACSNSSSTELSGTSENTSEITWTTSGDGVFLPGETELTPEYVIGVNDLLNEEVMIFLTGSGLEGCQPATDTLMINITTPLIADFSFGAACAGSAVQFTDQTEVLSGTIDGWSWDFGNGSVATSQNPSVVYTEAGNYNVSLIVRSSIGCNDTIAQVVNVAPLPIANFTISDNPAPINFDVTFTSTSENATSLLWNMGDEPGQFNDDVVTYSYPEPGNYTVTLTALNSAGCADSTSRILNIDGRLILPPRLPNTFSPNEDGLNDVYFVRGGPFTEFDFKIYNGWGQEIFNSTSQENGWDGNHEGKQLPLGVYVYTLKATNVLGNFYEITGKINLLR